MPRGKGLISSCEPALRRSSAGSCSAPRSWAPCGGARSAWNAVGRLGSLWRGPNAVAEHAAGSAQTTHRRTTERDQMVPQPRVRMAQTAVVSVGATRRRHG